MNFERINFVKYRKRYFIVSAAMVLIGVLAMIFVGFNAGVDFKAGTSLDIAIEQGTITKEKAIELIRAGREDGDDPIITIGGADNRVSARFDEELSEEVRVQVIAQFQEAYGTDIISFEENTVDTAVAREFAQRAFVVVAIASLGIILYVSIRFEWRFALSAVIALLHDALIVLAMFAIFRLEFNLPIIAAVLTIIGYSINDTIVLFDRIRENLRVAKVRRFDELEDLVNVSIQQTMTRSINTLVTILFAALCLFVIGSVAIKLFSLALLIGLIAGGYSSVFLAAQLWLELKKNNVNPRRKEPATN